jgi:hypothetical protein
MLHDKPLEYRAIGKYRNTNIGNKYTVCRKRKENEDFDARTTRDLIAYPALHTVLFQIGITA